jgi:hypothetical protein
VKTPGERNSIRNIKIDLRVIPEKLMETKLLKKCVKVLTRSLNSTVKSNTGKKSNMVVRDPETH